MIFALPEIKSDNRFEAGFSLRCDSIMFLFDLREKTIILFATKFAQMNRDK